MNVLYIADLMRGVDYTKMQAWLFDNSDSFAVALVTLQQIVTALLHWNCAAEVFWSPDRLSSPWTAKQLE